MLGSKTQTIIGGPVVPDAAVHAAVEGHVREVHFYFLCSLFLMYFLFYFTEVIFCKKK